MCIQCAHMYLYVYIYTQYIYVYIHTHSYQVLSDVFYLCVISPHYLTFSMEGEKLA